jgi:hypothetical protein
MGHCHSHKRVQIMGLTGMNTQEALVAIVGMIVIRWIVTTFIKALRDL